MFTINIAFPAFYVSELKTLNYFSLKIRRNYVLLEETWIMEKKILLILVTTSSF